MRVLAVTTNASLAVALDSFMRDWEVVTVRDLDAASEAGAGAAVALVDVGDTDNGLEFAERLYRRGVTIPFVIIGDRLVEDDRVTVLVRPFSLEELGSSVREAAQRPSSYTEPARPAREAEPVEPAAPEREPDNGRAEVATSAPAPPPPAPPPPPPVQVEAEPEVVTEPKSEVVTEPEPVVEAPREQPRAPEPEPEPVRLESVPEQELEPEPEPAAPARGTREPMYGSVAPTASPAEQVAQAETEPAQWPRTESAADAAWRKRLRRKPARTVAPEPVETPLVRRLKQAAQHARELETLLEELPFLADLRSMADGLAGEIESVLSAPVASVFVRWEDGYHVVGHRGLSRVEMGMVVSETQSLFSDVLRTGEGILIQPVDLAQGLVAGIGGARTEAFMAAPAVIHGECVAIVVAGGDRFTETDLDRLSDLAAEAAPGLSVAQLLERLRAHGSHY